MKCKICFEPFESDSTVFINKDTSDTGTYCETDKPLENLPSTVSMAAKTIGRRLGRGTLIEEDPKDPIEDIEEVEVVKETAVAKVVIPDLPEISEKDITLKDGIITFERFDEIKATLEKNIKIYKSLVMTSDDKEERIKFKKISAQLNKDAAVVKDIRILIKNKHMEVYDTFKTTQMDVLENIIINGGKGVSSQLDALTLEIKEQKKIDIDKEFASFLEEYPEVDFLTLETIWDKKWLNEGFKIKKIIAIFEEAFNKLKDDVELIKIDVNGARIKRVYLENGFKLAQAKTNVLQAIASEQREQARIDAQMEANNLKVDEEQITAVKKEAKEEVNNTKVTQQTTTSNKVTVKFAVTGDRDVVKAVVAYLRESDVVLTQLK